MKAYIVVLGGEHTFAVYAPSSKSAVDKACRGAGYPGSSDEAAAKAADEEALELFDDEFEEARQSGKPVKMVTD